MSNEIVRAMMRQMLEEYFKQQRQRVHSTTLKSESQGKIIGESVSHKVMHDRRTNQLPSEQTMKLLVTDTPGTYFQVLMLEEQRLNY